MRMYPNKFPSTCLVCNIKFAEGTGWAVYDSTHTSNTGFRGRPKGSKFRMYCNAHKPGNDGFNETNQKVIEKEVSTSTDSQDELDAMKMAPKDENNSTTSNVDVTEILKLIKDNIRNSQNETVSQVVTLLADMETRLKPVPTKVTIIRKDIEVTSDTGLQHYIFPKLLKAVASGKHVYLVGPAGSGKTTIAGQVSKALGKPFGFCGAQSSPYQLTGFRDAHGHYEHTLFRKLYETGGTYLFDEMDAWSANALLAFNAHLSNGHGDFPDGVTEMHPDFIAIASANTVGHGQDQVYVGRNKLDGASLDRFIYIPMDYDENLERSLIPNHKEWAAFVHNTRKATRTLKMRHIVSMRAVTQGAAMLEAGFDMRETASMTLYKGWNDEDINKVQMYAPMI